MSLVKLAIASFRYYFYKNLVLALGVAAATAVLTGALIVGDSMRASLRELALDRLGKIDEILVADGFFRVDLAEEITSLEGFRASYSMAEPVILFPNGSVQTGDEYSTAGRKRLRRVSKVNVFGIGREFWGFAEQDLNAPAISGSQVIVNQALADQLGLSANTENQEPLTLRIPKPSQLPSDSALGNKRDLIESLVELDVAAIVPNQSIGRFGLHVSQLDSPNIFVPIELLQEALCRKALKHKKEPVANAVLLAGKLRVPDEAATLRLLSSMKPGLSDYGLNLKEVRQMQADSDEYAFNYYSLSSDRLVIANEIAASVKRAMPDAVEVFTYLANDIRKESKPSGIPFSMIASIDVGASFPLRDIEGQPISPLQPMEIVLNEWAANDLDAKVDDRLKVSYFEPEAAHGEGVETESFFVVKAIAKLSQPDSPFQTRRSKVIPAQFLSESPTLANDPDLTPEVPGLTDAESIEAWDLPFATADKLRAEDDDYWNEYRTTPKAFVSLKRGQELWDSRFGNVTSFRIPKSVGKPQDVEREILAALHAMPEPYGFSIVPVKRQALKASSGSTPFDALFLALSMFVIGAALILVSLLFRLTLQQRADEIGTLLAVGWTRSRAANALLMEMFGVALLGAVIGLAIGVGYAAVMIYGLKTWWLGAISKPILSLKVAPWVLGIGGVSGLAVCLLTVVAAVRSTKQVSVHRLLGGEVNHSGHQPVHRRSRWLLRTILCLLVAAIGLSIAASYLGGEPQAGAFMGAGFLVLAAMLLFVYRRLNRPEEYSISTISIRKLAAMSARRNPLRSTMTIGLVAVASFLIVAVSSFRLAPSEEGTGGFDLIATSDQPIFERVEDVSDLKVQTFMLRVKDGEDASCNNLYQSSQPRVLGVSDVFLRYFSESETQFRWASTVAAESSNPWLALNRNFKDGAIPVVIDKNTANYSLKIFAIGGDYEVEFASGESVTFRVVGFLENSILQGSLLVSEESFVKAFPGISGYRMMLVRGLVEGPEFVEDVSAKLEDKYSDIGLDAQSAVDRLAQFQQVQNTYISTFQTLGALGLLLGTFGLAVVQIRNVIERRRELGLMRSVGFRMSQIHRLILLENIWLLLVGLFVGVGSALVTTVPHYWFGNASIPWQDLAALFLLIVGFGIVAAWLASRTISRVPLIQALRR